jgi:hypothetical protein
MKPANIEVIHEAWRKSGVPKIPEGILEKIPDLFWEVQWTQGVKSKKSKK